MPGPVSVAAVLLAAGSSRRFGAENKLLARIDGVALVRAVANALAASRVAEITVVTGHDRDAVMAALGGLAVREAHNARHLDGMGSSVATGIAEVAAQHAGALVVQADMPGLDATLIDQLIAQFVATGAERIIHPVDAAGRQANPVLWPRRLFTELAQLTGDKGGKALIECDNLGAVPVAGGPDGCLVDVDTPEDLARYFGQNRPKTF